MLSVGRKALVEMAEQKDAKCCVCEQTICACTPLALEINAEIEQLLLLLRTTTCGKTRECIKSCLNYREQDLKAELGPPKLKRSYHTTIEAVTQHDVDNLCMTGWKLDRICLSESVVERQVTHIYKKDGTGKRARDSGQGEGVQGWSLCPL